MASPQPVRQMIPSDPELERLVLGSIISYPELFHQVRPSLTTDDFLIDRHKRIWRAACACYDQGNATDRITVLIAMKEAKEAQDDEMSFLCALNEGLPEMPSLDRQVTALKEKTLLRRTLTASRDIGTRCLSGSGSAQSILDAFARYAQDLIPQNPGTGLHSSKEIIERIGLSDLLAPRQERGIPFPWPWMNHMTGGMLPGELWVLGGYTGMGKTSAMLQHAIQASRHGYGVAIFSLETTKESLFAKAAHQVGKVCTEIAGHVHSTEERASLRRAAAELQELPLYFDDTARTVIEIHSAVRRQKCKSKIDMIIVDYLQLLMGIGRHSNRAEEVGANAWACKMMASEFKAPVLLLSGFSRPERGKESRRPEIHDLKSSGDIENHANGVWFVHGEPAKMNQPHANAEFLLAKQRSGPRNISHKYLFLSGFQRFEETTSEEE
jgi:replicative DNA helicase